MQLLSLQNLRRDGRSPNQLRFISINYNNSLADGSCLYQQGNSKLLVSILGPANYSQHSDNLILYISNSQIAFNSGSSLAGSLTPKLLADLELHIKHAVSPLLHSSLNKSIINIHIHILQHDGSLLATSINAVSLALVHANIPMLEIPFAVSVGSTKDSSTQGWNTLVDLNSLEQDWSDVNLTCAFAFPHSEKLTMIFGEKKCPLSSLETLIRCSLVGARQVYELARTHIVETTTRSASRFIDA